MQYRQIGGTEIVASTIAMGTWALGGWMWGGCDDSEAERAIYAALDAGVTLVDTAPIYGFGRSEETVGRALRNRRRDSVVLASKCGLYWSTEPLPPGNGEWHCYADDAGRTESLEKYVVYRWLRADVVRRGVEDSLRRLRTDYIDVMQVHHVSDRTTPISETMGVLEDLRREGKIRAIGISNANVDQFDEYFRHGVVDVLQERFSMLDRSVEKNGLLAKCCERGASFFAYSPLENGLLTGRMDPKREFKRGDLRLHKPKFSSENIARVNDALSALSEIAKRYDLTVGQLAVAWVASRYDKAFALCGARNPAQALENSIGSDVLLTSEEFDEIDAILDEFELLNRHF